MIKTIILCLLYVGITGLYTYMRVLDYKKLPCTEQEQQELNDSITEVCKLLGKTESEVIKIISIIGLCFGWILLPLSLINKFIKLFTKGLTK